MAFKFYCPQCGHSEYISGSARRKCPNCSWNEGEPINENYMAENATPDENICPECGGDCLNWEVLDDELYQISGGYDARELQCWCSCCDYREKVRE